MVIDLCKEYNVKAFDEEYNLVEDYGQVTGSEAKMIIGDAEYDKLFKSFIEGDWETAVTVFEVTEA